jgi:hypothetical protein
MNLQPPRALVPLLLFVLATIAACAGLSDSVKDRLNKETGAGKSLDAATVAAGLREALEQGTARAVQSLGQENGFWSHPRLRIPMPEKLQQLDKGLRRIGQDRLADDFVRSLNRAAEQATPAAREIFVGAIRKMTIQDAVAILRGPQDAATQYFRQHTQTPLAQTFRPIVTRSTQAVGVTANYKRLVEKAAPLGIVDTHALDIDDYVTRKALDALYELVADEERRIREDPVARTTELLRKVFR